MAKKTYAKSVEVLVVADRKVGEKVFSVELMSNGGFKVAELFNTKGEYEDTAEATFSISHTPNQSC